MKENRMDKYVKLTDVMSVLEDTAALEGFPIEIIDGMMALEQGAVEVDGDMALVDALNKQDEEVREAVEALSEVHKIELPDGKWSDGMVEEIAHQVQNNYAIHSDTVVAIVKQLRMAREDSDKVSDGIQAPAFGPAGVSDGISTSITGTADVDAAMESCWKLAVGHLSKVIYDTACEKGWWPSHEDPEVVKVSKSNLPKALKEKLVDMMVSRNDGEMFCLMHSEISEALEAVRVGNPPDDKIPEYKGTAAELADVVIRIMDYCHVRGLDLAGAVLAKIEFNKNRPYKHGGKKF